MNQHAHKIIFNKRLGRMDVVSEIVSNQGKGSQTAGHSGGINTLIKPLVFALMLTLGTAQILPAQAQVIADPSAPKTQQATILPTASGATQVNIQTPSNAGVSLNQYQQFDTQSNGTVLNNSRTNVSTQTAGWIQGNPWLATGTARIIVNQVNSSNPSLLSGNIEVAGNRAEVIIANPSGIQVNGAAFLNAGRTTLTTGNPILSNGALSGYQVNQGQISVNGQGLNTQSSDYTDLLARSVQINAGIWAKQLKVTTGVNNINATNDAVTPGSQSVNQPQFAIDTSALGGMYAGKISLIGTEQGVGVNNAGQIAASAGNISVDVNGMLSNSGTINANLDSNGAAITSIKSQSLNNTGTISAQGNTQIQTGQVTNSGTIAAGRELKVDASDINNSNGIINGQRVELNANSLNNTSGKIQQTGTQALALNSGSLNNSNNGLIGYEPLTSGTGTGTGSTGNTNTGTGTSTPPSTATGGGSSSVVQPAPVALADGVINITGAVNNDAGQITANGGIDLTAKNGLENHATLNLNQLTVSGDTLDNSSGRITTSQTNITTQSVNNIAGQIQTYGNSSINAKQIDNTTGLIRSDLANQLTADSINNSNTQGTDQGIEGGTIAIKSAQLINQSGAMRAKVDLTAESMGLVNDTLDNSQGIISSSGTLNIKDNSTNTLAISNTDGQMSSDGNASLQAKSLTGDGTVTSNSDLSIALADNFNNAATTQAVGNLMLSTAGDLINTTALKAGNGVHIQAQSIDNQAHAQISSAHTQITANDTVSNRGLIDGGDTFIKATTVNNVGTGRIYGDHIAIGGTTLNNVDETVNGTNTAATIAARSRLDIGVQTLKNQEHALLYSDGVMSIGGALDENNHATGTAVSVQNKSATIESMGDMQIAAQSLINSNEHYSIKRVPVGTAKSMILLSPEGDPNRYDISNFEWRSWSRAGLYVWKHTPAVATGTILGQTPILSVGQQNCSNPNDESTCATIAGAEYPSTDPAWNYFGVSAPAVEPIKPTLIEPVRPSLSEPIAVASTDPNYAQYLADKTAYDNAMSNYNQLKSQYDAAQSAYQTAHDAWFADADTKYEQLADKIEAYNSRFNNEYKAWTQFHLTQTEQEDQTATSDPAVIRSGGNMHLKGGTVTNDKSTIIAGKTMIGSLEAINNIEGKGEHITYLDGTSEFTRSRWRGGFKRYHQRDWYGRQPYHDADHQSIDIPVAIALENTPSTGSGTQIATQQAGPSTLAAVGGNTVSSIAVNQSMPNSSLFTTNPDDPAYLIQTDPKFADYKNWLSSDWMLNALKLDPSYMHKRLGDGYYEQKLIREQVAQLTGRRYLAGYQNDEEQYKALMNAGVTFAQSFKLTPGIALTAKQVAQLTSDIVWLETQSVILPNGNTQQVLAPKLYAMVRPGDISPSGALLSGENVQLNLTTDLNNSGTIAGRKIVNLNAQNLNHSGHILSNQVALSAENDINIIGGAVRAQNKLSAIAGQDINITTTTQTTQIQDGTFNSSRTSVDRVAGLHVSDSAGQLIASAGQNIHLTGAQISSAGQAILLANKDLTLDAIQTEHRESTQADDKNYRKQSRTDSIGSTINANDNLSLQAAGQIKATAANLNSEQGTLSVYGKEGVEIQSGVSTHSFDEANYRKNKGLLSSNSREMRVHIDGKDSVASNLTGAQVQVQTDKDLAVKGSNIVSDTRTTLSAGNDVRITASENSSNSSTFEQSKKSGLMGTGGIGFMIGKKQDSTDTDNTNVTQTGSQVGSLGGKVNVVAGNHYQQTGSSVTSGQSVNGQFVAGDAVNIVAKDVDIVAGQNTYATDSVHQTKQSGLTVAVNVPVVNAVMAVADSAKTIGESKNDRVNAMAAANTAYTAVKAADALKNLQNVQSAKDLNVSVSITVGSSQSKQETHSTGTEAVSSTVAGKEVNIIATGAGTDSNIHVQGSNISGTDATRLIADNKVTLESAQNTSEEHSSNKSSGWNAGVAISYGQNGLAFGITAGGNVGKGKGEGSDVTQVNSHVGSNTGQTLIQAGGDTTLAGAQVLGKQVTLDTQNLSIESRQDTHQYNSKQMDASAQVTVGYGASVSGSYSQSKVNADYASVTEQSGIIAGDGGYNINVKNHTDLKGGIITSTQAAENAGLNSFSTGTLTASDIQNHADYDASGFGIGGSVGINGKGEQGKWAAQGANEGGAAKTVTDAKGNTTRLEGKAGTTVSKSIGYGSDSGHDSSTTRSGINTANITITDTAGQNATGTSAEQIRAQIKTDTTTDTVQANSGAIANNFDREAVQKEIGVQVAVTKQFDETRQGVKAEINKQVDRLQTELKSAKTSEEKAAIEQKINSWQKAGTVTDMIAGGLSAPTSSGLGIAAATAAPAVQYQIGQIFKGNEVQNERDKLLTGTAGTRPEEGSTLHVLAHTILAAAIAAAGGNDALTAGLSAGGAELLTPKVANWLFGNAAGVEKDEKGNVIASKLSAEQKQTVSNIVSLGAAGAILASGGSGADAVSGSSLAQSAVEDNILGFADLKKFLKIASDSHANPASDMSQRINTVMNKSKMIDERLAEIDKKIENFRINGVNTLTSSDYAFLDMVKSEIGGKKPMEIYFGEITRQAKALVSQGKLTSNDYTNFVYQLYRINMANPMIAKVDIILADAADIRSNPSGYQATEAYRQKKNAEANNQALAAMGFDKRTYSVLYPDGNPSAIHVGIDGKPLISDSFEAGGCSAYASNCGSAIERALYDDPRSQAVVKDWTLAQHETGLNQLSDGLDWMQIAAPVTKPVAGTVQIAVDGVKYGVMYERNKEWVKEIAKDGGEEVTRKAVVKVLTTKGMPEKVAEATAKILIEKASSELLGE